VPTIDVRMKGKKWERAACMLIRDWFPDVRTKRAGGETAKQDRGRDLLGTPAWCVQVKARQAALVGSTEPAKWLREAEKATIPGERPLVLWKPNRKDWCVVFYSIRDGWPWHSTLVVFEQLPNSGGYSFRVTARATPELLRELFG